jgi:hypothetical protein
MAKPPSKFKRWAIRILIVLLIVGVPLGVFAWYKFFRALPQPEWITSNPEMNFLYGSIDSENDAGMPYWLVVVLPRVFGQYLPGPGGYASLGLPWEEGKELPTGFSKKTIGFERVAFNCALCHSTRYRTKLEETPVIVAGGGSHTADIQGLLDFFSKAANDPRFNADEILTEIDLAYPLSWIDRQIYRYLLIPITRKRLIEQGQEFEWTAERPRWGPGRNAPMNLTKFNFLQMDRDDSIDHTDFPSLWNLQVRSQEGRTWPPDDFALEADFSRITVEPSRLMLMNIAGDTTSFRSVLIDSALGLRARNSAFFHRRMADLEQWLRELPPPKYPLPVDATLASAGATLFEQHCGECHTNGRDNRLGTVIPNEEIKTDPLRTDAWLREAANSANRKVQEMGVARTPMSKPDRPGYIAMQLDGLWLRGPYLHNGSVPTVRALLDAPDQRPKSFYRGFDVLDPVGLGFVSQRCCEGAVTLSCVDPAAAQCIPENERAWAYDVSERGNGNGGHDYGTALSPQEKNALVEYMKTL